MPKTTDQIIDYIRSHRCYRHPIFEHWVAVNPAPEVIGALFHQIQNFCAATRPGWGFPGALRKHGLARQGELLQEIVESEENHGRQLATMVGFILNRAASRTVCPDLDDQDAVERRLRAQSDELLGTWPGYDAETGLTAQARKAMAVFDRRKLTDWVSTLHNLGTALALEMISNNHVIPGEKYCLVDSGLYGVSLGDAEMHYLLEHWGESGAEREHERNAVEAVAGVINEETGPLILEGVDDLLDSLSSLWDLLDAVLLTSGYREVEPVTPPEPPFGHRISLLSASRSSSWGRGPGAGV